MPAPLALIGPALKMLATQGVKQAAIQTAKGAAKNAVKNKAKNFVTGKGRKKKGKRGKGGALVKSGSGQRSGGGGGGGSIVASTPMVGNYRVETVSQKPGEVGKPSKVSFEAINNQLDSIIALTGVLKKTSAAKMKTAINRRKAERKAAEKEKKRLRESLLEAGKGAAGMIGGVAAPITKAFDPLKFFTNILLGSLLMWIIANGSKITAFLKMTLALFNNAGKLLKFGFKQLGKVFKAGLKLIGKLGGPIVKAGKALKKVFGKVGSKIGKAFKALGRGLANFGLNILNKIKNAGRAMMNLPAKGVNALKGALTGGGKGAFAANKGLNKLIGETGSVVASNAGTASRAAGTMSNATRSLRLRHGDEAARMYQGLIDNGMKPSRASKYVSNAISSGKLTSQPLQGLARQTGGSQLLKGGPGRSANRVIAKLGGKNALKATKALKASLGRIPIIGGLITLVVSLLSGEPVTQALFKAGGAVLGGFLGSFIPIPVIGTLFGEILGEYVGDLMYVLLNGGGAEAVGQKLKQDLEGALSVGQKALDWIGNGFQKFYKGIPKVSIPGLGWITQGKLDKIPDPLWLINPLNPLEKLNLFWKSFFGSGEVAEGETKDRDEPAGEVPPPRRPEPVNTSEVLSSGNVTPMAKAAIENVVPETIDNKSGLDGQITKNWGFNYTDNVYFTYNGNKYRAMKGPSGSANPGERGWSIHEDKLFGSQIDTTGGKNQAIVAHFIEYMDLTHGKGSSLPFFEANGGFYDKKTRGFLGKTVEEAKAALANKNPGSTPLLPSAIKSSGTVSAEDITPGMSRKDKFMMIYNAAVAAGDPMPALSAAQSMFETGFLTSELSLKANNPYGQTGKGDAGYYDYRNASKNTKWALYSSYNAAVKHHIKRWSIKTPQGNPGYSKYDNPMEAMRGIIENYAPAKDSNNHAHYLAGVEAILKEMGFDPNAPETPQLQPQRAPQLPDPQQTVQPQAPLVPGNEPQTTQSVQVPPTVTPPPTGTGLTNIVPVENLQSIGAGTGEVGMTSGRGMRTNPVSGKRKHHAGVDIGTSGKRGYYVAFKLSGKVSDVGTFSGYGKTVVLTCGDKDFLFAHLAQIMVRKGQAYNGEIIGEIGNTGAGTGEHLHFEASPAGTGGYGKDEDPMPYVKYLTIGKMGDGSPVGTNDPATMSIQDPSSSVSGVTPVPGVQVPRSLSAASISTQPGASQIPNSISQNLSYQLPGGQQVIMMQSPGGQQLGAVVSGGGQGSIVMMGSQEVLNSYHKSQILGFLYKQG